MFFVDFKELGQNTMAWTMVDAPRLEEWKRKKKRKLEASFTAQVDSVQDEDQRTFVGVTIYGKPTKKGATYALIVMLEFTEKGKWELPYGEIDTFVVKALGGPGQG